MDAITTHDLSKRFRRTTAVRGLNLQVPSGKVFALLGPNGAGKSTTLKMLMNLLRPSGGSAIVLGRDSRKLGGTHFREIGYVSEDQRLPLWMTVRQYLDFLRPFYPAWDEAFRERLTGLLDLDLSRKLKACSRGMRMKAALLGATAFRPKLLVLDEPFSGLDPLVREQFIQGMLELTQDDGWTILLSSHDMDEVERVADHVAFLDTSRLLLSEPAEALLGRFRRVEAQIPETQVLPEKLPPGWLEIRHQRGLVTFVASDFEESNFEADLRENLGIERGKAQVVRLSLREIFVAIAKNRKAVS